MLFLQIIPQPNVEIPPDSILIQNITKKADSFLKMSWHDKAETMLDGVIDIGLKLIAVVAVLIVCRWLIGRVDRLIDKIFVRRRVDSSLNTFIRSMLKIMLYLILAIIVISILGIKTTSFVAILASAAFAVGMALSGTLQNFAGGILILLLKPFRTGDYIRAEDMEGTVREIKLFSTILITPDNKTIIIPNGGLSSSIVNNFSKAGTRRVEWNLSVAYGDDYDTVKKVLEELLRRDSRILEKPPFLIALKSLDQGGVGITVRAWTKSDDYQDVFFDINENVYKIFPVYGLRLQNSTSGSININLSDEKHDVALTDKVAVRPSEAEIKKSIREVCCDENNTKSADNSITKEDIDYADDGNENPDDGQ